MLQTLVCMLESGDRENAEESLWTIPLSIAFKSRDGLSVNEKGRKLHPILMMPGLTDISDKTDQAIIYTKPSFINFC